MAGIVAGLGGTGENVIATSFNERILRPDDKWLTAAGKVLLLGQNASLALLLTDSVTRESYFRVLDHINLPALCSQLFVEVVVSRSLNKSLEYKV